MPFAAYRMETQIDNRDAWPGHRHGAWRGRLVAGALVAGLLSLSSPAAALTEVGETVLVVKDVKGEIQERVRILQERDTVFQDELIITGSESASKIVFADETELSVGPGTQITLDSFVYDPSTGEGTFNLSMTKGVLRFTSGKLSSATGASYNISTPSATIGIRGTTLDVIAYRRFMCVVAEELRNYGVGVNSLLDSSQVDLLETDDIACTNGFSVYATPSLPTWAQNLRRQLLDVTQFAFAPAPPPDDPGTGVSLEPLETGDPTLEPQTLPPEDNCAASPTVPPPVNGVPSPCVP